MQPCNRECALFKECLSVRNLRKLTFFRFNITVPRVKATRMKLNACSQNIVQECWSSSLKFHEKMSVLENSKPSALDTAWSLPAVTAVDAGSLIQAAAVCLLPCTWPRVTSSDHGLTKAPLLPLHQNCKSLSYYYLLSHNGSWHNMEWIMTQYGMAHDTISFYHRATAFVTSPQQASSIKWNYWHYLRRAHSAIILNDHTQFQQSTL
jgi:hypothetical protein